MKYFKTALSFTLLAFMSASNVLGQNNLQFIPMAGEVPLELHKSYALPGFGTYQINKLKFYILLAANLKNIVEADSMYKTYHLIDAANTKSFIIPFKAIGDSMLSFYCGVDSLTQVSGVFLGGLDPLNAMYWTWQSGYIAIKIEGEVISHTGEKTLIEHHIGGYRTPYYAFYKVQISNKSQSTYLLGVDINYYLSKTIGLYPPKVMSPGKASFELGRLFSDSFIVLSHEH